ncbi:MAG: DUF6364 family protein [Bacteroidota bacterium]
MDTKLTLKLEQKVIEKAKDYAKEHKTSLSKLIENYLQKVTSDHNQQEYITPLVKSLSGIIQMPENINPKESYTEYLTNKYR